MSQRNIRQALQALRLNRGRSLLTMFGIIVGVVAVVVAVGIGEGVKRQVASQINQLAAGVVVVRPGILQTDAVAGGAFSSLQATSLTEQDVEVLRQTPGVQEVVPLAAVGGFAEVNGRHLDGGTIIATTDKLPDMLDRHVAFGTYFTQGDLTRHVAVVGRQVAEQLFQENVPIGRTLTIRGQDYIVRGVFEDFATAPNLLGTDLNKAVFVSYPAIAASTDGSLPIAQALVRLPSSDQAAVAAAINQRLAQAHGGQQDFTVFDRQQELTAHNHVISLLTQMIAAMAALSLLVGGIGIINIMFVSVTERTREIGIRKAVGATNRQIMNQFLIEATTLSVVGGVIGAILSLVALFLINILTSLQPVVPVLALVAALLFSWIIGIIFGVAPAIKAARKDPIDALHYE